MSERLYRSHDDRMIAGVAGGVAELLDADPSLIRIVWAVLIFLTGGLALVVYIVIAIVVPERPAGLAPGAASCSPPEPAPDGSWRAPDGSTVPLGSTPPSRAARRGPDDAMRGGLIAGLLLIVIGGFFLLREVLPAFDPGLWWPVAAIGLGVVLVVLAMSPSRHSD